MKKVIFTQAVVNFLALLMAYVIADLYTAIVVVVGVNALVMLIALRYSNTHLFVDCTGVVLILATMAWNYYKMFSHHTSMAGLVDLAIIVIVVLAIGWFKDAKIKIAAKMECKEGALVVSYILQWIVFVVLVATVLAYK